MAKVRITAGARKHMLTRTRILAALDNAVLVDVIGDAEHYVGTDDEGGELEMILVPDDRDPDRMACIHAMPRYYREGDAE